MKRRIVLIGVAVVLALFGTFAVYSYANNADERAVADGHAVKVLIATKRVAAGTSWSDVVKSGNLSVQNLPAGSAPQSALTSVSDGVSPTAVAQSDIAPGQVVLRESFGTAAPETGVLAIPKGMVAVTVSLGSDQDVAGYVAPRSQVVIFVTSKLKTVSNGKTTATPQTTAGDDLSVTKTVLPRTLVIATSAAAPTNLVGKTTDASATTSTASVLVTLAVTQQDAERLILAQHVGDLYLGLLSDSSKTTADPGVTNLGLFKPAPIFVK
jgi:pilus assembly protein CpaB